MRALARASNVPDLTRRPACSEARSKLHAAHTWPNRAEPPPKASSTDAAAPLAAPRSSPRAPSKLAPAPTAPAAVSLSRGTASEQFIRDAIEKLRQGRLRVLEQQGYPGDANAPLETLFEDTPLEAAAAADGAAAAAEAGPLLVADPTHYDDDDDNSELQAALLLSMLNLGD